MSVSIPTHLRRYSLHSSASIISQVYRMHITPTLPLTLASLIQNCPIPAKDPTNWTTTQHKEWLKQNEPMIVSKAIDLHQQMPIGLAKRIVDLETLPYDLPQAPSVVKLRELLLESFAEMIEFPVPKDLATQQEYIDMQMKIRAKHATMHDAIQQALKSIPPPATSDTNLTQLLDDFYHSRIGLRLRIDQHREMLCPKLNHVGVIAKECQVLDVLDQVVKDTKLSDLRSFSIKATDDALSLPYIGDHLAVVVTEMINNAIRNTADNIDEAIAIQVAGSTTGICIRVSDRGTSNQWQQVPQLWSYLHETTSRPDAAYDPVATPKEERVSRSDHFGMPIARLYARYFGGDLTLMSMDGYGTDSYLHLNRISLEN